MSAGIGHGSFCELTHVQLTEEQAATVATCVKEGAGLAGRLAEGIPNRELVRVVGGSGASVYIPGWVRPLVDMMHLFVTSHGTIEPTPRFMEICLGYAGGAGAEQSGGLVAEGTAANG